MFPRWHRGFPFMYIVPPGGPELAQPLMTTLQSWRLNVSAHLDLTEDSTWVLQVTGPMSLSSFLTLFLVL